MWNQLYSCSLKNNFRMGAAGSWALMEKVTFLFLYLLIVEQFWEFCITNCGYWGFKKLFFEKSVPFICIQWSMRADKLHNAQKISAFIPGYKIVIHYFKNTFFFFSASCWSCRRCLPETWIWCWLAGSKIITFLTVFYQSVYNGLYNSLLEELL